MKIAVLGSASTETKGLPPQASFPDGIGAGKVVKCLPQNFRQN